MRQVVLDALERAHHGTVLVAHLGLAVLGRGPDGQRPFGEGQLEGCRIGLLEDCEALLLEQGFDIFCTVDLVFHLALEAIPEQRHCQEQMRPDQRQHVLEVGRFGVGVDAAHRLCQLSAVGLTEDVRPGQKVHDDVLFAEGHGTAQHFTDRRLAIVRMHDAFGQTGGAGGVDDQHRVGHLEGQGGAGRSEELEQARVFGFRFIAELQWLHLAVGVHRSVLQARAVLEHFVERAGGQIVIEPALVGSHFLTVETHALELGQVDQGVDQALIVSDDDGRLRVVEDVDVLLLGGVGVRRGEDESKALGGTAQRQEVKRVPAEDRDAVTARESLALQEQGRFGDHVSGFGASDADASGTVGGA